MLFQVSHGEYVYHIGICGKLSQRGCEQSSLCRVGHNVSDIRKYTYSMVYLESGHLKLVYHLDSPPASCGNHHFIFFVQWNVVYSWEI